MKKIILYSPSIHTGGGTERVLINLSNELLFRGFEVEILSQRIGDDRIFDLKKSIKVKQLYFDKVVQRFNHLFLFKILNKFFGGWFLQIELYLVYKADFSAIVAFSNSIILSCFRTSYKNKLIAFEHWPYRLLEKNPKLKKKVDIIYPKLKKVVVLTQHDKNNYEVLGCNVSLISNSFSINYHHSSNLRSKIVLNIGHFNAQKRKDLLIKAWGIVNQKHPDWTLLIVGDGEEKNECLKLINDLGLEKSIRIVKPTKDIDKYYLNSSIFVLTSEFEALPLVLIEAKTFGIPCVSFDIETGPKEIIKNNVDGFLVPFADYDQLAGKVSLLIEDNQMRSMFGEAARIDALIKYEPNVIYNKWSNILIDEFK